MKIGESVKTIGTTDAFATIYGKVCKITKYGEHFIKVVVGNKYHKKGKIVYVPKHLLKSDGASGEVASLKIRSTRKRSIK